MLDCGLSEDQVAIRDIARTIAENELRPVAAEYDATARHIDGKPRERPTMYSAMAKLFASDVAVRVTIDALQVFGGYGYMRDYPIEKYMRDAKITQIYEGTNQIQCEEISKILIGNHISGKA